MSQIIDQVMRIKTHTESSKSELSSRGKRPFKVRLRKIEIGEIIANYSDSCIIFFVEWSERDDRSVGRSVGGSSDKVVRPFVRSFVRFLNETLNRRLPLEDSSDFDDSVCVLIVMT